VLGGVVEEAACPTEAGVGKCHVDPPVRLQRGRDHPLLVAPLGDVARHRECVLRAAEVCGQLLQSLA
jgi:hypothetical protein